MGTLAAAARRAILTQVILAIVRPPREHEGDHHCIMLGGVAHAGSTGPNLEWTLTSVLRQALQLADIGGITDDDVNSAYTGATKKSDAVPRSKATAPAASSNSW